MVYNRLRNRCADFYIMNYVPLGHVALKCYPVQVFFFKILRIERVSVLDMNEVDDVDASSAYDFTVTSHRQICSQFRYVSISGFILVLIDIGLCRCSYVPIF